MTEARSSAGMHKSQGSNLLHDEMFELFCQLSVGKKLALGIVGVVVVVVVVGY